MISIESAIPCLNEFTERQIPMLIAPGIGIGLTRREHFLHMDVFELANREAGQPVRHETLFQIGFIINPNYLPWSEIRSEPGLFRVGNDLCSPELIRFDVGIDGKALQVILSGGVYSQIYAL